jgi:osmotically inducible protein OsmC
LSALSVEAACKINGDVTFSRKNVERTRTAKCKAALNAPPPSFRLSQRRNTGRRVNSRYLLTPTSGETPMPVAKANAEWNGTLREGSGRIKFASGVFEGPYSFKVRSEGGTGQTTPEELIGAAHAGCFSMALSAQLTNNKTPATYIRTEASVHLVAGATGLAINRIDLVTRAKVPGIDPTRFAELAKTAKEGCPVSKALAAVDIHLDAALDG